MGRLRIRNETSFAPTDEVRQIARWVLDEIGVKADAVLNLRESTKLPTHHGRFYSRWNGGHVLHFLDAYIPEQPVGVYQRRLKKAPPPIRPLEWEESLVCILAHEIEHLRQYLARKKKAPGHYRWVRGVRYYVRPRLFSEVQAEWAEYRLLHKWRERSF